MTIHSGTILDFGPKELPEGVCGDMLVPDFEACFHCKILIVEVDGWKVT
jgi:hypothetical protein